MRPKQIVVDLTHCEVLDFALLHLLLSTHRQLRRQEGRLTIRGLSPRLVRVVALGGLTDVFDVEPRLAS